MLKTFVYSLFAVFLFGLGAAGSWFVVQARQQQQTGQATTTADVGLPLPEPTRQENPLPEDPNAAGTLPVAARGRPMSAEEIFRFGAINRKRQEALRQREEEIKTQERRLKLAYKDIEARQQEIEGLLLQLQDKLNTGDRLLAQLKQERDQLNQEREQQKKELEALQQAQTAVDPNREKNFRRASGWLQSMEPEKAAAALKETVDNGDLEYALNLLSHMEDREVAKILDALDDPTLVADMTRAFRQARLMQKAQSR